jgi:hypothetical protein
MAKGPKVSHPEYLDFNCDEDDLLGDDDLLVDRASDVSYNENVVIMIVKRKRMTML